MIAELGTRWGQWSPPMITRLVLSAIRLLHPPTDDQPGGDEVDAHACRDLSFALLGDTVILSGTLPRLEGEAVIAAIDALAERLRSTADHVPAGARRADALVELVNAAATTGALPTRGGLPVALTVTLEHTRLGDPIWTTNRGHLLTPAEQRFTACDPTITPIAITTAGRTPRRRPTSAYAARTPPRTARHRRRLAHARRRTHGRRWTSIRQPRPRPRPGSPPWPRCSSTDPASRWPWDAPPGPPPPPNAKPWPHATADASSPAARSRPRTAKPTTSRTGQQAGPPTSTNLALLCWTHHRQVDLTMWTITPTQPGTTIDEPPQGSPPGTPWPGNNGSPWTIRTQPRTRWRS